MGMSSRASTVRGRGIIGRHKIRSYYNGVSEERITARKGEGQQKARPPKESGSSAFLATNVLFS
jgi:hypothetical protein